jgi:hypothetical protein
MPGQPVMALPSIGSPRDQRDYLHLKDDRLPRETME